MYFKGADSWFSGDSRCRSFYQKYWRKKTIQKGETEGVRVKIIDGKIQPNRIAHISKSVFILYTKSLDMCCAICVEQLHTQ